MTKARKFLIYYATVVAATLLAAVFLNGYVRMNIFSLIPMIDIVVIALYALRTRKYENLQSSLRSLKFSKRGGDSHFQMNAPAVYDTTFDRLEELVYLVCVPLPLPFVFFFSDNIKLIASAIALCLPFVIPLVWLPLFIRQLQESKREHEQRRKELEEQKKREEMGQWK